MEEEVPSSAITVTRSQTLASSDSPAANNITKNGEDTSSELGGDTSTKSRPYHDRAALFDISNDSPIVGLAKGCSFSNGRKNMSSCTWNKTPGSGEALLRRQVKNLLQRVEEEAVISKFILDVTDDGCCDEKKPPTFSALKNFFYSPMGLLGAPTPSNTPQENEGEAESDISQNQLITREQGQSNDKTVDSGKCIITRSLLFDFSDKSEISTADWTGSSSCHPSTMDIQIIEQRQ